MSSPVEEIIFIVISAICSYLIGALPFGYLIGRIKGIDIRQHGSGNIGATNVTRVVGKGWGRLCFILDFLKSALPVLVVSYLSPKDILPDLVALFPEGLQQYSKIVPDDIGILPVVAAFSAVCGHIWPVYLKFKGGKGVSTAAGAILALNPLSLLGAGLTWVVTFEISRYVSLASIIAAGSLPVFCLLFKWLGWVNASVPEVILFFLLAILTVLKHQTNIKRLLQGTENRFERKKE